MFGPVRRLSINVRAPTARSVGARVAEAWEYPWGWPGGGAPRSLLQGRLGSAVRPSYRLPNPNKFCATLRIWISSEPSVIR
jgi:hypothetical protein